MSTVDEPTNRRVKNNTADNQPDVLTAEPLQRRKRRHRSSLTHRLRRRARKVLNWNVITLVAAIAALLIVGAVVLVFDSFNRVQSSVENLNRVMTSLNGKQGSELTLTDLERLQGGVSDLSRTLGAAQSRFTLLKPFTGLNPEIGASMEIVDAARHLALAATDILNGLQPTLFYMVSGDESGTVVAQISSGERIIELLRIGRSQFTRAAEELSAAQRAIDAISLTSPSPQIIAYYEDLLDYNEQLTGINNILLQAPDILTTALGITEERSYLVLSQNNDELRPSGGYISTYGWMTMRNGRITAYDYYPTTAETPLPPPASLAAQINIPGWWINYGNPIAAAWDGSWYADFPSTAEMAMWYYNNGNNRHAPVDGVISIDITGFEYLIEALGSVTVPGYPGAVSTETFRNVIYGIRADGEGRSPHKEYLVALYRQILNDWQAGSANADTNQALLGAFLRAIQEKHIMIYFPDDALQNAVRQLGWTGEQASGVGHDYLMVADANLGNKSNYSIQRQITYDVDLQPAGSVIGTATVAYDYSARIAESDPAVNPEYHGTEDYHNLLQVFVPPSSELIESANFNASPTTVNSATHTDFVSRLFIPFDSVARPQLAYRTPPVVETFGDLSVYRLLLQKQPGSRANVVSVTVSLPPGASAVSITPEPAAAYNLDRSILEFRFNLLSDAQVEIVFSG